MNFAILGGFRYYFLDRNTGWIGTDTRLFFSETGGIDGVMDDAPPPVTTLGANYPNPFTGGTTIPYEITGGGQRQVRIEVYDAVGRRVRTVYSGYADPGRYTAHFDGTSLLPGVYFVRLASEQGTQIRKMLVVR